MAEKQAPAGAEVQEHKEKLEKPIFPFLRAVSRFINAGIASPERFADLAVKVIPLLDVASRSSGYTATMIRSFADTINGYASELETPAPNGQGGPGGVG